MKLVKLTTSMMIVLLLLSNISYAEVAQIEGFTEYCAKGLAKEVCTGSDKSKRITIKRINNTYTSSVKIIPDALSTLTSVNKQVNAEIIYTPDATGTDVWEIPSNRGDCEDYVLTKIQRLISQGWNSSNLRIAVLKNYNKTTYHAVLIALTSNGAYVLDNFRNEIVPLKEYSQTDYNWNLIQLVGTTQFISFNGTL